CPILKNRDDIRTWFKIASPFLKLKKLGLTDRPEAIISGQSTPPNMVELVCPRRTRARLLVGKNFSTVVGKVMGDGVGSTNDGLVIKRTSSPLITNSSKAGGSSINWGIAEKIWLFCCMAKRR